MRDGDILTAKRLIGEALTRNKRNGSGWLVAAKIEEKMENYGLVGLILRRGIECAPMDTDLYSALAEHEMSAGRIDSVRCSCILWFDVVIGVGLFVTYPFHPNPPSITGTRTPRKGN